MILRFGFMETPNVPKALGIARKLGWQFDIMSTSILSFAPFSEACRTFGHASLAGSAFYRSYSRGE